MILCVKDVNDMGVKSQQSIAEYVGETLGVVPRFTEWSGVQSLPYVIRSEYNFSAIELLGRQYVGMFVKNEEELSPASTAKHLTWLEKHLGVQGIILVETMESFNRKRLIGLKVPFIVPGNQLYLPDLGIDLREYFKRIRKKPLKLSPSAQFFFIAYLLRKIESHAWTATALSKAFHMSKMTMGRAIDELKSHGLAEVEHSGRERYVVYQEPRRTLWEKAQYCLTSPVQTRVLIENTERNTGIEMAPLAGISALSQISMLAGSELKTRAISSKEWKSAQPNLRLRLIPRTSRDLVSLELEIWKYDPRPLNSDGRVDPLSLYLSLKKEQDERVEAALEKLLEEIEW